MVLIPKDLALNFSAKVLDLEAPRPSDLSFLRMDCYLMHSKKVEQILDAKSWVNSAVSLALDFSSPHNRRVNYCCHRYRSRSSYLLLRYDVETVLHRQIVQMLVLSSS